MSAGNETTGKESRDHLPRAEEGLPGPDMKLEDKLSHLDEGRKPCGVPACRQNPGCEKQAGLQGDVPLNFTG